MDFERVIAQAMPLLNEGVKLTVLVSVLSLLIGMIIGFFICIMGRSRVAPLKWIAAVYIWIIRGTPHACTGIHRVFRYSAADNNLCAGFQA